MTSPLLTEPDPQVDDSRRRPGAVVLAAVLGGLLVLLVAAYVALHVVTSDKMPTGARIGGVDIGGKTIDEARTTVSESVKKDAAEPVSFVRGKKTYMLEPDESGLAVDVDASVAATGAAESVWNPLTMVSLLVGDHTYPLALDVDTDALSSAISSIADDVDRDVTEGAITFEGTEPQVTEPKAGRAVDVNAAVEMVRRAYPTEHGDLELPVDRIAPRISSDDLTSAVSDVAEPAVSAPVTVAAGAKTASLSPSVYAGALSIVAKDGKLVPEIDPKELAEPLADATKSLGTPAKDATIAIRDGKPTVVPGEAGVGVVPKEVAAKLVDVLTKTGAERRIEVETKKTEPTRTTDDVTKLGITEKVSTFTTKFPYATYRNVNQGRAASLVNGTLLEPGDTFSFNDTVGERTAANGFTTGTMISNGVFREDLGGGVSQVATTLYNAGFFAGLEDVTHKPHSFYISRYPVGREATVAWPTVDLKFTNTTDHGIFIQAWVDKSTPSRQGAMNVVMWGTKQWDVSADVSAKRNFRAPSKRYDATDKCVPQQGVTGFDIDVVRTFSQGGKVLKRETKTAKYNAADTVVCGPAPGDKKND